jgi:lipopolysaccharide biosynthesis glycosyltransferase
MKKYILSFISIFLGLSFIGEVAANNPGTCKLVIESSGQKPEKVIFDRYFGLIPTGRVGIPEAEACEEVLLDLLDEGRLSREVLQAYFATLRDKNTRDVGKKEKERREAFDKFNNISKEKKALETSYKQLQNENEEFKKHIEELQNEAKQNDNNFHEESSGVGVDATEVEDHLTPKGTDLHIALAADNYGYLLGAGVAITSVMKHAKPSDHYNFYVYLTGDLAKNEINGSYKQALADIQTQFTNCQVNFIPIQDIEGTNGIKFHRYGLAGVLRIALPALLPNVDRLIYMDCDMVAIKDLRPLYDLVNDQHKPLAAVLDKNSNYCGSVLSQPYGSAQFEEKEYVNSGLLVMDLKRLRDDNFSQKVFKWLRVHTFSLLPDQDAINAVYKGKINILDYKYAWPTGLDQVMPEEDVWVVHYAVEDKPWNDNNAKDIQFYKEAKKGSAFQNLEVSQPKNNHPTSTPFYSTQVPISETNDFVSGHHAQFTTSDDTENPSSYNYLRVNDQDETGRTALMRAVLAENLEAVQECLKYNYVEHGTQDKASKTALMHAAEKGNDQIMKALLADLEVRSWQERATYSEQRNWRNSILMLQDETGKTALHYAVLANNQGMADELAKLCADLCYIKDDKNKDPFTYAIENGYVDMVQALINYITPYGSETVQGNSIRSALLLLKQSKNANFQAIKDALSKTFRGYGLEDI